MTTVKDILRSKGNDICSIRPDATVFEGLELMAKKDVGALLVLEGEALVGIFSERDYARRVILYGRSSKEMHIRELMTKDVYSIGLDHTIQDCMAVMTEKHIRHLPVVQDKKLVGVLSIGDVVKKIIADQKHTIRDLENYITGNPY